MFKHRWREGAPLSQLTQHHGTNRAALARVRIRGDQSLAVLQSVKIYQWWQQGRVLKIMVWKGPCYLVTLCAGNRLVFKSNLHNLASPLLEQKLTVHFMTLPINTYSPLNLTTNSPYEGGCSWVFQQALLITYSSPWIVFLCFINYDFCFLIRKHDVKLIPGVNLHIACAIQNSVLLVSDTNLTMSSVLQNTSRATPCCSRLVQCKAQLNPPCTLPMQIKNKIKQHYLL